MEDAEFFSKQRGMSVDGLTITHANCCVVTSSLGLLCPSSPTWAKLARSLGQFPLLEDSVHVLLPPGNARSFGGWAVSVPDLGLLRSFLLPTCAPYFLPVVSVPRLFL